MKQSIVVTSSTDPRGGVQAIVINANNLTEEKIKELNFESLISINRFPASRAIAPYITHGGGSVTSRVRGVCREYTVFVNVSSDEGKLFGAHLLGWYQGIAKGISQLVNVEPSYADSVTVAYDRGNNLVRVDIHPIVPEETKQLIVGAVHGVLFNSLANPHVVGIVIKPDADTAGVYIHISFGNYPTIQVDRIQMSIAATIEKILEMDMSPMLSVCEFIPEAE